MRTFKVVLALLIAVCCFGMTIDNPTITKIANLTTNGFITTSSSNGTLGVDTNTYAQSSAVRELLSADRTYYVRTDGNDSNTCLANTAGGACLTVQHAVDLAATTDFDGHTVTIQIADGTYTGAVVVSNLVASQTGGLTIQGNSGTPANVVISTTSASAFTVSGAVTVTIKDMKIATATSGHCLVATRGRINFTNINFGACAQYQVYATNNGIIFATGDYTISGNSQYHILSQGPSQVTVSTRTVTLTGTPAFSSAFVGSIQLGYVQANSMTFSGSGTGVHFVANFNGVTFASATCNTYFPGNSNGTAATGGLCQ